jgi:hypothetical protein
MAEVPILPGFRVVVAGRAFGIDSYKELEHNPATIDLRMIVTGLGRFRGVKGGSR